MKWVFVLLMLANAALYVWEKYYREPQRPINQTVKARTTGATHVNRLLMLSEIDSRELRERPPVADGDDAAAIAAVTTPRTGAAPTDPTAESTVTPNPQPRPTCLSIGPLAQDSDPGPLRDFIGALGGVSELRAGERRELARYWVYFPPLEHRTAANARMDELRVKGVDDIYMIARGDMANAISLGVYSRKDSLRRRVKELNSAGYQPSVIPRYRTQKASWLDTKLPPGKTIPAEDFARRFQDMEANTMICNDTLKLPGPRRSPTIPVPAVSQPGFETPDSL